MFSVVHAHQAIKETATVNQVHQLIGSHQASPAAALQVQESSSSAVVRGSNDSSSPAPETETTATTLDSVLHKKYGGQTKFSIDHSTSQYAQGSVLEKGGGEKWWLATLNPKTNQWQVIADGYSYVNCTDIAHYQFPSSMVPVCWSNSQNTLIDR